MRLKHRFDRNKAVLDIPDNETKRIQTLLDSGRYLEVREPITEPKTGVKMPEPQPLGQTFEDDAFAEVDAITPAIARALKAAGIDNLDALREASDDSLLEISGIGEARLKQIREQL